MNYIKRLVVIGLVIVLLYTRFVNLGWGLPYPFHPDERNMAVAVQQLKCIKLDNECFNPHFFAYGQFPLYLAYAEVKLSHFFSFPQHSDITFDEATIALRAQSAVASVLTVFLMWKLSEVLIASFKGHKRVPFALEVLSLLFIFSPGLIQLAHFGTTESLLMFFYTLVVYLGVLAMQKKMKLWLYVVLSGICVGLALATKVSAYVFGLIPLIVLVKSNIVWKDWKNYRQYIYLFGLLAAYGLTTVLFAVVFSPYNFIDFKDFIGSMQYESAVGFGTVQVFYTRQYETTVPVLFQLIKIFPYALGLPALLGCIGGLFLLPWKKDMLVVRLGILFYFAANAFLYAKWTRFMAPIFPLMLVAAVIFYYELYRKGLSLITHKAVWLKKLRTYGHPLGFTVLILLSCLPGIAYLSIYNQADVRVQASQWINEHIPAGSHILSETANVVDLPLFIQGENHEYDVNSFNFYDIDTDPALMSQLQSSLYSADYIFVPSRRIFANSTCISPRNGSTINLGLLNGMQSSTCTYRKEKYPLTDEYYKKLFSGKLGYKKIAEFIVEPTIHIGNNMLFQLNDEGAEETWSVFDHPIIRIYQRI